MLVFFFCSFHVKSVCVGYRAVWMSLTMEKKAYLPYNGIIDVLLPHIRVGVHFHRFFFSIWTFLFHDKNNFIHLIYRLCDCDGAYTQQTGMIEHWRNSWSFFAINHRRTHDRIEKAQYDEIIWAHCLHAISGFICSIGCGFVHTFMPLIVKTNETNLNVPIHIHMLDD